MLKQLLDLDAHASAKLCSRGRVRDLFDVIGRSLDVCLWITYHAVRLGTVLLSMAVVLCGSSTVAQYVAAFKSSAIVTPFRLLFLASIEYLIELAVKSLVRRQRPTTATNLHVVKHRHETLSFPSGHSMRSGMALVVLASGLPPGVVPVIVTSWCIAIAVSRVVSGNHFLLDSVAGFILGVVTTNALQSMQLFDRLLTLAIGGLAYVA